MSRTSSRGLSLHDHHEINRKKEEKKKKKVMMISGISSIAYFVSQDIAIEAQTTDP
jgi:hypothetical protein